MMFKDFTNGIVCGIITMYENVVLCEAAFTAFHNVLNLPQKCGITNRNRRNKNGNHKKKDFHGR